MLLFNLFIFPSSIFLLGCFYLGTHLFICHSYHLRVLFGVLPLYAPLVIRPSRFVHEKGSTHQSEI